MKRKHNAAPPGGRVKRPVTDSGARVRRAADEAVKKDDAPPTPEGPAAAAHGKGRELSRRRRNRRKRVRLGEALRQRGLDEHTLADNYVGVLEKLKDKTDKSGGVEKLLVDVLKECSRHLEPARPADRLGMGDVPVRVHLVHNVARPERPRIENRK